MGGADAFILDLARGYGRWIYILATLLFFVCGYIVYQRAMKRRVFTLALSDVLITQVGMLGLLTAFAMQTGQFPFYFAFASVGVGLLAWLLATLLLASDKPSAGMEASAERYRTAMALVFGANLRVAGMIGLAQSIFGLMLIGIFIWGAFAFDPSRFDDGARVARLAILFLTVPAIFGGLLALLNTQMQVASKVAPPGYRNLMFASSVMQCVSQSILIFGPFLFFPEEFAALGLVLPSSAAVLAAGGAILAAVLLIPYVIGFFGHARLARRLSRERREIFERAGDLARWEDCDYRDAQLDALTGRIISQYRLMSGNPFLAYIGLELLLHFVSVSDPQEAARRRAVLSPVLAVATPEAIEAEKQKTRRAVAALPAQFQTFLEEVDSNDWGDLVEANVIVQHFYEIMQVLPRIEAGGANLEYLSRDLLAAQNITASKEIATAQPAILFALMSSLAPQLWRIFGDDVLLWLRANWQVLMRLVNVA